MDIIDLKDAIAYQDGSVVSKEIVKTGSGTMTLFAFDAGQGLSEHKAPFQAVAYVIEGKAEISVSGKAHLLSDGQMIQMPAGDPHSVKAVERFKMVLTMLKA
jgi:quercetin dioxygenase-like cupin family protein